MQRSQLSSRSIYLLSFTFYPRSLSHFPRHALPAHKMKTFTAPLTMRGTLVLIAVLISVSALLSFSGKSTLGEGGHKRGKRAWAVILTEFQPTLTVIVAICHSDDLPSSAIIQHIIPSRSEMNARTQTMADGPVPFAGPRWCSPVLAPLLREQGITIKLELTMHPLFT